MKIKGILKSWFWISLHQGMLSIICSRIQGYMLSLMNEVDPCLLLLLCVLYEMQNQIFQQSGPANLRLHVALVQLLSIEVSDKGERPTSAPNQCRGSQLSSHQPHLRSHTKYSTAIPTCFRGRGNPIPVNDERRGKGHWSFLLKRRLWSLQPPLIPRSPNLWLRAPSSRTSKSLPRDPSTLETMGIQCKTRQGLRDLMESQVRGDTLEIVTQTKLPPLFRPHNLSTLTLPTTRGKGIRRARKWQKEGRAPHPRRPRPKKEQSRPR